MKNGKNGAKNSPKHVGIVKMKGEFINGSKHILVALACIEFAPYQRPRIKSHVVKMSKGFEPLVAQMPKLSLRDGTLWCMDGGNTTEAMLMRGIKEWDAILFTGLTYGDEAHLFYMWNNERKLMTGWKNFYADLEGGNKTKQDIVDMVHKYGLTLPGDIEVDKKINADICNASTLTTCYKKGGIGLVEKYCKVLRRCWKHKGIVQHAAKEISLTRGLIMYLADTTDMVRVIQTLKIINAEQIRVLAKGLPSKGRTDSAQMRQAIANVVSIGKLKVVA